MKKASLIVFLWLLMLYPAFAKVYMLGMPYLLLQEALSEPDLSWFLEESAVGLMNIQTNGTGLLASSYATLGAGSRAHGLFEEIILYRAQDPYEEGSIAKEIYEQRTNNRIEWNPLVFLDIEALKRKNAAFHYDVVLGLFGSLLGLKGLKLAYIGNIGSLKEQSNPGALAVINRYGIVSSGENRDLLVENPLKPLGAEVDVEKVLSQIHDTDADVIFVELGDLERLESISDLVSEESYYRHRKDALKKAGLFLKTFMESIYIEEDKILLFCPHTGKEQKKAGFGLGFLAIHGTGFPPGLLFSQTTKRQGMVALTDLAPTIESWHGITVSDLFHRGGAVITADITKNQEKLLEMEANSAILKLIRPRFYQAYISTLIVTILAAFTCIVIFPIKQLAVFTKALLFGEALVPLLMLLVGLVPARFYLVAFIAGLLIAPICGAFSVKKIKIDSLKSFWLYFTVGSLIVLLVDVFSGARLIPRSVFGYDYQSGARFYGIGNEYMGYLVGLFLLGAYFLGYKFAHKKIVLVLFALGIVGIAFPMFGANVGGGITMIAAFLAWIKIVLKKKLGPYFLIIPGFVGLWMLIDFFRGQSHFINTIRAINTGGFGVMWDVILRKINTNLRLWQYSLWTKGLIAFAAGLTLVIYKPAEPIKVRRDDLDGLKMLLLLTVITATFAICFNDSGVVAGALVFLVPGCFVLNSLLETI